MSYLPPAGKRENFTGVEKNSCSQRDGSFAAGKGELFILPAGDPPEHDFDRQPEARQLERGSVRAVTMRPCAVNNEQRAFRPFGHALSGNLAPRQVQ